MSAQDIFDSATVRVNSLIYLPSISATDSWPDVFAEDFVDNLPEREDAPLYAALPKLKVFAGDEAAFSDAEEVAHRLFGVQGFLVEAQAPVRTYRPGGSGFSYSWGYSHVEWLYAPDEASIAPVCAAWAEAMAELDKVESAAEAGQ